MDVSPMAIGSSESRVVIEGGLGLTTRISEVQVLEAGPVLLASPL